MWGKIFGGFAGFTMGGPFGAVFGAAAGHAFDRFREEAASGFGFARIGQAAGQAAGQIAFTLAVVNLGAKLAKVDGPVNRAEVNAFREVFRVEAGDAAAVGRMFDAAKRDAAGFEPFARQLAWLFRDRRGTLQDLLAALFHIARADGTVRAAELDFLRRVSDIFGIDALVFERLHGQSAVAAGLPDAYAVLGLEPDTPDAVVKTTYRRLIREHHPDSLAARGMAAASVARANERMAVINAAFDRIRRERGLK